MKGTGPCCAALEKRKSCCNAVKTRDAQNKLITILSSNDSNGFTSFKINVLKQRFLILFFASPALLSISLSLIQIISSAPSVNCIPIIYFRHIFHIREAVVAVVASNTCWQTLLTLTKMLQHNHVFCCIKALIRIKLYIRS